MAEQETLAQIDAEKTQSAEEGIADFLFGAEEEPEEELAEAGPNVQVEGDDEPDEPEEESEEVEAKEDEEGDEPEYVEIEYDGQLYEVPANLKDALLRQDDYTKKTQAVADQRKQVEVVQGELKQMQDFMQFQQSISADIMKAQQLEQQEQQLHQYLRENVENMSHSDIEKIRFGIEDARRERENIQAELKQKEQEHHQAQEQTRAELLKKGNDVLRSKIPGWGEESAKQVRNFALESGFSEAEIEGVLDPRHVEVLWKASQYDSLKAGAAPAVKKVQAAPTIKPKSRNPMPESKKQELKLRKQLKSGKLSAPEKAKLIGEDIANKFF